MGTAVRDFSSLMSPFPTPVLVAHAPGRAGLAFPCTSGRATERTINGKGAHRSIAASALVSFTRPEGDEYGRSRRIQRPPIAVVEGPALGVRLEIVLACDLVVATARPAPSFRVLRATPATVASRRPGQSGAHGRLADPTLARDDQDGALGAKGNDVHTSSLQPGLHPDWSTRPKGTV